MKKRATRIGLWFGVVLLLLVIIPLGCCQVITTLSTPEISKSQNPPATLQELDLVGTWKADYGSRLGVDKLILREDGTFKQIYENRRENYTFETPWNKWWLERFPDGRIWVHLKGARYYLGGIPVAEIYEKEGWGHDPFHPQRFDRLRRGESIVHMVGKVVLNVRVLPSGELVLAHMWPSCDSPLGDKEVFHREETSSPLETPTP